MSQQISNRDLLGVCRELRKKFCDWIVERELIAICEDHYRSGRKLFGNRCQIECSVGGDWLLGVKSGKTVCLEENSLAILNYQHGRTRRRAFIKRRKQ